MRRAAWRDWPLGRRVAAVAFAATLLLDLAVLAEFRHLGDDVAVEPLRLAAIPSAVRRSPGVEPAQMRQAGELFPFGETGPGVLETDTGVAGTQATIDTSADEPRLVGTVIEGDGKGFVVVELPDSRMQLVRIGERAGTMRLRSVAAGVAVFENARGERVSLRSPVAGSGSRQ